ncbi:MAG: hypothetical protein ACLUB5_00650 [Bifidobacterium dentium]
MTGADIGAWPSAEVSGNYTYKVKNVKNVTQLRSSVLRHDLFTVVALLVAGAGITVAPKSASALIRAQSLKQ